MITGQIFIRNTPHESRPVKPGHHLVMFTGIVAVPNEMVDKLQFESLYTIFGDENGLGQVRMTVDEHPKDVSEISLGNDLGQMILEPIWRV